MSERIGQIWVLAVISITMIAYQNCVLNRSRSTSQINPTAPPAVAANPVARSSCGHDQTRIQIQLLLASAIPVDAMSKIHACVP